MARGGSLQKAGFAAQALGVVAALVDVVFPGAGRVIGAAGQALNIGTGTAASVAGFAIFAGQALQIVGTFVTPYEPPEPGDDRRESPVYGFHPHNPQKGDAPLSVPFGEPLVRPVLLQAWTTPHGLEADEDFGKALKQRGQAVSMLFGVAADRIQDITDVRLNGELLWNRHEDQEGNPKLVGQGNGSRKVFKVNARRVERESIRLYVDGTLYGWKKTTRTERVRIVSGKRLYSIQVDGFLADDEEPTFELDGTTLDSTTAANVNAWMSDESTLKINTQTQLAPGSWLTVTLVEYESPGVTITQRKRQIEFRFETAPAAGAKVTATFLRRAIPGVQVFRRLGGSHQLPIPGFSSIKQGFPLGSPEIVRNSFVSFTTENEVDDVVIDIASGSNGFTVFDDEGNRDPAEAQFTIDYRKVGDSVWTRLLDPGGPKTGPKYNKGGGEFRVRGDVAGSQYIWSFSIRGLLENLVRKRPTNKHKGLRDAFTRAKYEVRIRRTNTLKADGNERYIDRIYARSRQEVIEEFLNHPGVALFALHGVGSAKLNGRFPTVDLIATGLKNVEKWDGSAWVQDDDAHKNPVWAVVEAATNARWGLGQSLSKADNIDATSAKEAADWCDESAIVNDSESETRAILDVTLDTRAGFQALARDLLLPAQVIPVWRGDTLAFVIDKPVEDLSSVPSYAAQGSSSRIPQSGASGSHDDEADRLTELDVVFYDKDDRYEQKPFLVVPKTSQRVRRSRRMELFGCARRTQAQRVSAHIHAQATSSPPTIEARISVAALRHQAGDVFRIDDDDLGVESQYWRCTEIVWPSVKSLFVTIRARQYVLANYGQTAPAPPLVFVDRTPPESPLRSSGRREPVPPPIPVTVRRIA